MRARRAASRSGAIRPSSCCSRSSRACSSGVSVATAGEATHWCARSSGRRPTPTTAAASTSAPAVSRRGTRTGTSRPTSSAATCAAARPTSTSSQGDVSPRPTNQCAVLSSSPSRAARSSAAAARSGARRPRRHAPSPSAAPPRPAAATQGTSARAAGRKMDESSTRSANARTSRAAAARIGDEPRRVQPAVGAADGREDGVPIRHEISLGWGFAPSPRSAAPWGPESPTSRLRGPRCARPSPSCRITGEMLASCRMTGCSPETESRHDTSSRGRAGRGARAADRPSCDNRRVRLPVQP